MIDGKEGREGKKKEKEKKRKERSDQMLLLVKFKPRWASDRTRVEEVRCCAVRALREYRGCRPINPSRRLVGEWDGMLVLGKEEAEEEKNFAVHSNYTTFIIIRR